MALSTLRCALAFSCVSIISLSLNGCAESGDRGPEDVTNINVGFDAGAIGCSQPLFPAEQPDLSGLNPPRFLLTTTAGQQSTAGQAQVDPGDPIDAEITVNGATRRVRVELADAWAKEQYIYTDEVETSGNQTISLLLFSEANTRGRYYLRLTLCGLDCDERAVVFDIHTCSRDRDVNELCGINAPYERTLIEDGELVRVDSTCIDLGPRPGVGSGTVLIQ